MPSEPKLNVCCVEQPDKELSDAIRSISTGWHKIPLKVKLALQKHNCLKVYLAKDRRTLLDALPKGSLEEATYSQTLTENSLGQSSMAVLWPSLPQLGVVPLSITHIVVICLNAKDLKGNKYSISGENIERVVLEEIGHTYDRVAKSNIAPVKVDVNGKVRLSLSKDNAFQEVWNQETNRIKPQLRDIERNALAEVFKDEKEAFAKAFAVYIIQQRGGNKIEPWNSQDRAELIKLFNSGVINRPPIRLEFKLIQTFLPDTVKWVGDYITSQAA